jgi:hypothetical protein
VGDRLQLKVSASTAAACELRHRFGKEIGFALGPRLEGTGLELSVPSERRGRSAARHMGFARLHRGIDPPPNLPSAVFADVTKFNDTRHGGSVAIWPARGTHSVIPGTIIRRSLRCGPTTRCGAIGRSCSRCRRGPATGCLRGDARGLDGQESEIEIFHGAACQLFDLEASVHRRNGGDLSQCREVQLPDQSVA